MGNPNIPAAMPGKTKRKDGILTVAELRDKLTKIIEDNPERADWPVLTYSSVDEGGGPVNRAVHASKNAGEGEQFYNKGDTLIDGGVDNPHMVVLTDEECDPEFEF